MPTRSLASVIPTDDDTEHPPHPPAPTTATKPAPDKGANKPVAGGRAASSTTPRKSRRSTDKPAPAQPAADTPATDQRTGRARIPKTGPITRVTVDLALTEQTQLDKLTTQIGREIGRSHGKNKIYPQHLMRVAIRRLISDDTFRREVTADLAEHRDELKRPQR